MKIITWNVNGYRAVTGQNSSKRKDEVTRENKLFALIEKEQPDIICLQETKADENQIDETLRMPYGYTGTYHSCTSKKGYSGVVTFSRVKPENVKCKLGIDEIDCEGRIVESDFGDFVHLNIYFPKAYDDMTRMDFKLKFCDIIFNYTQDLRKHGRKVIISGDYNTAHTEIDLTYPQRNVKTSGFMPIEREKLDRLVDNGYVQRLADPEDRRVVRVALTETGKVLYQAMNSLLLESAEQFLHNFSLEERKELGRLLGIGNACRRK
jgi:exodeoxyribonuclease-3